MRKSFFIILLLSLVPYAGTHGQNIYRADSLYRLSLSNDADTSLLMELNSAVNEFVFTQPDTALFYSKEGLRLAKGMKFRYGIVLFTNMLGLSYEMMEEFDLARNTYIEAAKIATENENTTTLINIYNNLSILESVQGNYESSLEYLVKALSLAEMHQDSARLGIITNNIGLRFSELQNQRKALEYYRKAIRIYTLTNRLNKLDNVYGNIGRSYYMLGELDSAEVNYRKSIKMALRESDNFTLVNTYMGLGLVLFKNNELDSALKYQELGHMLSELVGDEYGVAQALLFKGSIKTKMAAYDEAEGNILEAISIATALGIKPLLIDAYLAAADLNELKGDYRNALKYKTLHTNLQDTLYTMEKDRALNKITEYEEEKNEREKLVLAKEVELEKSEARRQRIQRNLFILTGILLLLLAGGLLHRFLYVRKTRNRLAEQNQQINNEKKRSDDLLHNILPHETAIELKEKGSAESRYYEQVTVLFTDFVGFTSMAEKLGPAELVSEIDHYFKQFDLIITRHNIEKIKTIGDAYMCAGGIPVPNDTHALDMIEAALEIKDFVKSQAIEREKKGLPAFHIRIGIHTGPVVAGIVGLKKFAYDIWGDTVNTASRIESSGEPGKINLSQTTRDLVHHKYKCIHRGKIEAKGKGGIDMYYLDTE